MSLADGRIPETHKPSDPNDYSITDALVLANRDYARLTHLHQLSWQLDQDRLSFVCACDQRRRPINAIENHIRVAVRASRGPAR